LHEAIKSNIKRLLEKNFTVDILIECLELPNNQNIDDVVKYLVNQSVLDSISGLTIILQKYSPKRIDEIEEISGWLLLKSVDANWWFYNEKRMQEVTAKFSLEEPNYIEVIISRGFLRPAKYMLDYDNADKLNRSGKVKPEPWWDKRDLSLMVYDANDAAINCELLKPLYKDLFSVEPPHNEISLLLEDIIKRAAAKCRNRKGKIIYYLVTQEYLDILESKEWFAKEQEKLAKCLRFICCGKKEQFENPCPDGEKDVLEQLAELLMELKKSAKSQ